MVGTITSKSFSKREYGERLFNQFELYDNHLALMVERNMFANLYVDTLPEIQHVIPLWSHQQAHMRNGLQGSSDHQIKVEQISARLKEASSVAYISANFSLKQFISNIFKNRPGALKVLNGIHHFLSKLLKI